MAEDTKVVELLERLIAMQEATARQAGWLPDDELVQVYNSNQSAALLNMPPAVVLSPVMERRAQQVTRERGMAEYQSVRAQFTALQERAALRWCAHQVEQADRDIERIDAQIVLARQAGHAMAVADLTKQRSAAAATRDRLTGISGSEAAAECAMHGVRSGRHYLSTSNIHELLPYDEREPSLSITKAYERLHAEFGNQPAEAAEGEAGNG